LLDFGEIFPVRVVEIIDEVVTSESPGGDPEVQMY
jgi:hypothetical protein